MDVQYPRVNGASMQQYLGRPVLLIGQVIASPIGSGEAKIKASDGQIITAFLPPGEVCETQYMQLIGKVQQNSCIEVQRLMPMNNCDNFNLDMYNQAIELANGKFKHLFV